MFDKDQGISYAFGGRECSSYGLKRLSNEQECVEAVKFVLPNYPKVPSYLGVVNSPDFPTGCYIHEPFMNTYDNNRMYFNSHPNGKNDHFPSMETICKKGNKSFRIHILNTKVKDIYK